MDGKRTGSHSFSTTYFVERNQRQSVRWLIQNQNKGQNMGCTQLPSLYAICSQMCSALCDLGFRILSVVFQHYSGVCATGIFLSVVFT